MVDERPEQPSHAQEFAPLENSTPYDPYAPVDYPADATPPPGAPPPGTGQPAPGLPPPVYYPPPGFGPQQPPYPSPHPPPQGGWPGAYPPYDPYRAAPPQGTNGKAIAALVTSLVGLAGGACLCLIPPVVGLILGIVAMTETKRTGQPGRGMAIASIVISVVTIVAYLVFFAVVMAADPGSDGYDFSTI